MSALSPLVLEAWGRQTGHQPDTLEVEALLALDAVLRDPDAGEKDRG